MKKIEEKFSLIFKYMGIPKEQIRMEASFTNDFDFEEFQFACLVFYIGSYFKINIRERDYTELNTIGSAMDFVRRKLKRRANLKISRRENRPKETFESIPRNAHQVVDGHTILVLTHLSYRPLVFNRSVR